MKNNLRYRVVFMCFILIVSLSACSLSKKNSDADTNSSKKNVGKIVKHINKRNDSHRKEIEFIEYES